MRSVEEQIKYILTYKTSNDWPSVSKDSEYLADKTYFDFINVTYAEVYDYVVRNGFGPDIKEFSGGTYNLEDLDFQTCIERKPEGFEVFYVERGEKNILGRFNTREEAICYQVKKMMEGKWWHLTSNYCKKHYPDKTPAQVMEIMSPFDEANLNR